MTDKHEMIDPHWKYSADLIEAWLKGPMAFGEFCYKQAFAHGMKHQREICDQAMAKVPPMITDLTQEAK